MLRWLGDVITATCTSSPIVVGRTLGGAIAARFCAACPGAASRLVLVDTLGLVPFDPAPPFGAALARYMAEPSAATHARLMEYCAYDFEALRERLGDRWEAIAVYTVGRVRELDRLASIGALMAQFGMPAIPHEALARITTPTSLIWGRHDLATPLAVAESASSTFGWPLQVIEEAGDDPALEQPGKFVAALRAAIEHRE
jgi:pimeloyl-ACP methyl ester carboxylesterase